MPAGGSSVHLGGRAVFLDLQGTLGGDGLGDILTFDFFDCAPAAIRLINGLGLLTIVVSNQSHIAKGVFTLEEFNRRSDVLRGRLETEGAHLDGVYCCPHSAEDGCSCRKPLPGLLLRAAEEHGLTLPECYVVGDVGAWDIAMARAVGCRGILVRTGLGQGSLGKYRQTWADIEPDHVAEDVLDAARWIAEMERRGRPARPVRL